MAKHDPRVIAISRLRRKNIPATRQRLRTRYSNIISRWNSPSKRATVTLISIIRLINAIDNA